MGGVRLLKNEAVLIFDEHFQVFFGGGVIKKLNLN